MQFHNFCRIRPLISAHAAITFENALCNQSFNYCSNQFCDIANYSIHSLKN